MNLPASKALWGIQTKQFKVLNVPKDCIRYKIKQRNMEVVFAILKFKDRIEKWVLKVSEDGENAELAWKVGENASHS